MSRVDDSVTNQTITGTIPSTGFVEINTSGYPMNFTASLGSVSATRKIEASNDGVNNVVWPYDFNDASNLWLFFTSKCRSVKFTGASGDRWAITTGSA